MIGKKLKEIERLFQSNNEELPPNGFKTRAQWGDEFEISAPYCNRLLKKYVENGIMEVKTFKIKNGLVFRKVPHYRLIPKKRDKKQTKGILSLNR